MPYADDNIESSNVDDNNAKTSWKLYPAAWKDDIAWIESEIDMEEAAVKKLSVNYKWNALDKGDLVIVDSLHETKDIHQASKRRRIARNKAKKKALKEDLKKKDYCDTRGFLLLFQGTVSFS